MSFAFGSVTGDDVLADAASPGSPFRFDPVYAGSFVLRPHQEEVLQAVIERSRVGARVLAQVATGGGKTAIVSDACLHWVASGKRVLVVVKSWDLAAQFAADALRRHPELAGCISFVGPAAARQYLNGLPTGLHGDIVLTTIQSWNYRRRTDFLDVRFDVVVNDELHWGEDGDLFRNLLRAHGSRAAFMGLTATPRSWTSFEILEPRVTMADLIDKGFLARPVVIPISSGTVWNATRASGSGDFTATSLRALGALTERNEMIADICVLHTAWMGPTLIFACDIAHAEEVAALLRTKGLAAAAYHSRLSVEERNALLRAFRTGEVQFLVNVTALTMGIDLPEIRTLILARPTASETLHVQMVGRGVRLAPGKTTCNVIDLVDNVGALGDVVVRPEGFGNSTLPPLRGPLISSHESVIGELRPFPQLPGYEQLAGIPVGTKGTFGIEFEIALPHWREEEFSEIAWALRDALAAAIEATAEAPLWRHGDPTKLDTVHNVEPDPSCGLEMTTRILRGFEGFAEVQDALAAMKPVLDAYELGVDIRTGTHIHLGSAFDPDRTNWLRDFVCYFEPALLSLVGPSRATSDFCTSAFKARESLGRLKSERSWERHVRTSGRYFGVNYTGLFNRRGTLEIRWHSGTLEAPKILTWIGLWQSILRASEHQLALPGDPLAPLESWPLARGPRGDVVQMATFLGCNEAFVERLRARRDHVVSRWWARDARYSALAEELRTHWGADVPSLTSTGGE